MLVQSQGGQGLRHSKEAVDLWATLQPWNNSTQIVVLFFCFQLAVSKTKNSVLILPILSGLSDV